MYKIKLMLSSWPKGALGVQSWLSTLGISRQLADRYYKSGWLKKIDNAVYCLADDQISWQGIIYTLQHQLGYDFHIAATTALSLQGYTHYLPLGNAVQLSLDNESKLPLQDTQQVWLFSSLQPHRRLPVWFMKNFYLPLNIKFVRSTLFAESENMRLTLTQEENYQLQTSTPERAILECLDLAPQAISLQHIKELMEGMTTLRPDLLQALLENCRSIKVKRMFLLMADFSDHAWFGKIKSEQIELGRGKLVIGRGGYYYPKYRISFPIQLAQHEGYADNG